MPTKTLSQATGAELHYAVHGAGPTVLALHGAFSTSHEIAAILEPTLAADAAYRRIYPDLPGMGDSPAHTSVQSTNDVVDLLDALITAEIGNEPFLVVGHSYGAHIARGLVARRPDQVAGLALICPLVHHAIAEDHLVVESVGEPSEAMDADQLGEYLGYFVVQTPATAARFLDAVAPTLGRYDAAAVGAMMSSWALRPDPDERPFSAPVLVLTGRHDSLVGYRDQLALVERYPNGTHIVLANAGHALAHEHPALTHRLVVDWLERTPFATSS